MEHDRDGTIVVMLHRLIDIGRCLCENGDYSRHHPHRHTAKPSKIESTSNRISRSLLWRLTDLRELQFLLHPCVADARWRTLTFNSNGDLPYRLRDTTMLPLSSPSRPRYRRHTAGTSKGETVMNNVSFPGNTRSSRKVCPVAKGSNTYDGSAADPTGKRPRS